MVWSSPVSFARFRPSVPFPVPVLAVTVQVVEGAPPDAVAPVIAGRTSRRRLKRSARAPAGVSEEESWSYRYTQGRLPAPVEGRIVGPSGEVMPNDGKSVGEAEYEIVSSAFEHYLAPALPDPRMHKLYFDHGSETLDAIYKRYQDRVDGVVARRGYKQAVNWLTKSFPGQKHNEISWASRVDVPLEFLLSPSGR